MKIISTRPPGDDEIGMRTIAFGGARDGEEFEAVFAKTDDGKEHYFWKCNTRNGLFRQVFVPWNFKHGKVIG